LTTGQLAKIIDIAATYFIHDNVDQFSVDRDGRIDWKYFDPGEGLKVRLIYASPSIQSIGISGNAVGTTNNDINRDFQSRSNKLIIMSVFVIANVGVWITLILNRFLARAKKGYELAKFAFYSLLMISQIALISSWLYYTVWSTTPF
jgi:hypothetical protein